MKILFVSHSSVLQYHQQKLEILAQKFGLDIVLVTPASWPEGGRDIPAFTGGKAIRYEIGKTFMLKKRFMHFYLNAGAIIKKYDPDIIHLEEEPFVPAAWQFLRAARSAGKKTVFFTWENINRRYNAVYNYFERYSLKNADAAIAGNNEAMEILRSKGFAGPVTVIPQYGLNMADFKPSAGYGQGIKELAYIGRITPEKGIDTLVKAVAKTEGVTINIIGSGNEDYIKSVKELAEKSGAGGRVAIHGFMNREKLNQTLQKIQVLILPSLTTPGWKEQFGRVLIEAFASRIAVIGSSSGEIPFVIGDAGLVFREGDENDLADKIRTLTGNKDIYEQMVDRGYKRVSDLFTNEKIAEQIYSVYRQLM